MCINSYLNEKGIKTEEEFKEIVELGLHYRNKDSIVKVNHNINGDIKELSKRNYNLEINYHYNLGYNISNIYISSISKEIEPINSDMLVCKVDKFFKENTDLLGICVVDDKIVKGVVTRNSFYSKLGWQYGYSIYSSKPISTIMSKDFLIVDYKTPIEQVIKSAMSRSKDALYDFVTVVKEGKYYGIVTVKDLIEKTIEIEVDNARHLNPLTGLPGNVIIEQNLEKCISLYTKYCVLYFDIDNFKPYNDVYGFEDGDKIIKILAQVISCNISSDGFIGHIGGDDFIAIVPDWNVIDLCQKITKDFDSMILECYDKEDIENGYIVASNRHGIEEKFPLVSISIAALTNREKRFESIYRLAKESSKIKKKCKQNCGSSYIVV